MRKRVFTIMLTVLLTLTMVLPVTAEENKLYIIDQLGVVSGQLTELNQEASDLSDTYGVNVTLLLLKTTDGAGTPDISERIYQASFGESDGMMLVFSQDENEWFIYKTGTAAEVITEEDDNALWEAFASGEYYDDCVNAYLDKAQEQLTEKLGSGEATTTEAVTEEAVQETTTQAEVATEETAQVIPDNRLLPRLTDEADLLSDSEETDLLAKLDEISDRQKCDVVVATVNSLEGKTAMEYADDFYDYNGYGYGEERDGIILLISMEDRDWWMSTCGYGITAFTDAGQKYMSDKFIPMVSDGEYADAFTKYADLCDEFLTQAKTGEPYDKSNMPKESLNIIWLPIDLAVGLFAAFIVASLKKSKLKTVRRKAAAQDYVVDGSFRVTKNNDRFITKNVTTRTIHRDDDSGGSSTHTSSSGSSHGGSGGKF